MSDAKFDSTFGLPEDRDSLEAAVPNSAFVEMRSAIENVTDTNIEPGSVFNRHIVSDSSGPSFPVKFLNNFDSMNVFSHVGGPGAPLLSNIVVQPDPALWVPGTPGSRVDCRGVNLIVAFGTVPIQVENLGTNRGLCYSQVQLIHDTAVGTNEFARADAKFSASGRIDWGVLVPQVSEKRTIQVYGTFVPTLSEHYITMEIMAGAYNIENQGTGGGIVLSRLTVLAIRR